jgi:hypothetical protein
MIEHELQSNFWEPFEIKNTCGHHIGLTHVWVTASGRMRFGRKTIAHLGASTVKWTAFEPCSGLSESDPKLYTNFEFYETEIFKHFKSIWIYKAKRFMFTKNNFKQHICILEDGASGEQVGEIEMIIVKNLFKI